MPFVGPETDTLAENSPTKPFVGPDEAVKTEPFVGPDPETPDSVKARIFAPGSEYLPTEADAATLFRADQNKPTLQKVTDFVTGAARGAAGAVGDVVGSTFRGLKKEAQNFSEQTPANLFWTLAEGAGRGTYDLANIGRKALNYLSDNPPSFDSHQTPVSEQEQIQRYHERMLSDLAWDRYREQVRDGKAMMLPGDPKQAIVSGLINPELAEASSNVLDPSLVVGMPGFLARPLEAIPRSILSRAGENVAKFVEKGANQAVNLASLPEKGLAKAIEAVVPKAENAPAALSQAAMAGTVLGSIPGAPAIAAGLKSAQVAGRAVAGGAKAAGELAKTEGTSQLGRFEQVAMSDTAPQWLRQAAKNASRFGGDKVLEAGEGLAKGAAAGAAVGATLALPTDADAEELGAAAGSGAALGTLGHLSTSLSGHQKRLAEDYDVTRWYGRKTPEERAAIDGLGWNRQDFLRATEMEMVANGLTKDQNVKFQYLDPKTFEATYGAQRGVAQVSGESQPTIAINAGQAKSRTVAHELFHVLETAPDVVDMGSVVGKLFDVKNAEGATIRPGLVSPEQFARWSDRYLSLISEDKRAGLLEEQRLKPADFQNRMQSEFAAELFANTASAGSLLKPSKTQRVLDWMMTAERGSAIRTLGDRLQNKFGIKTGESDVFPGLKNTPEIDAMMREFVRKRRDLTKRLEFDESSEQAGPSVRPSEVNVKGNEALIDLFADNDNFRRDPSSTRPDKLMMQGGRVVLLSEGEIRRVQADRVAQIEAALQSVPDTGEAGAVRLKENGAWEGRSFTDAQLAALDKIPDHVLTPSMKAKIREISQFLKEPGKAMLIHYNAALGKNKRYSSSIRETVRVMIPLSQHISKAGNYYVNTLDVTHLHDKVNRWWRTRPKAFADFDSPAHLDESILKYLTNHANDLPGRTGLDANGAKAQRMANRINDLFNIRDIASESANIDRLSSKGDKDNLIRTRRFDRVNRIEEANADRMPIDYGLLKQNFSVDPDSDSATILDSAERARLGGVASAPDQMFSPSTPEFRDWFANSEAVNKDGSPKVFYHGTDQPLTQFEVGRETENSNVFGNWKTKRAAIFFTDDPKAASNFPGDKRPGSSTVPVFLSVQNPLDLRNGFSDADLDVLRNAGLNPSYYRNLYLSHIWETLDYENGGKEFVDALKGAGYDAVRFIEPGHQEGKEFETWAVFDPAQIKSSIGNSGVFSSSNPDIRFSPSTESSDVQLKGKPLPHSVGPVAIPIIHYSGQQSLKKLDPKFFGKGSATPTDLRGGNKAFAFVAGSDFGQDVNIFANRHAFGATIDGSRIYDLRKGRPDELGYFKTINREEADDNVSSAGYAGIMVDTTDGRRVVMLYKPVTVSPLGQGTGGEFAVSPGAAVDTLRKSSPDNLQDISNRIIDSVAKNGGASFNVAKNRMLGQEPVFAVSIYPDRSFVTSGDLSPSDVSTFIARNIDLLKDQRNNVGIWRDSSSGKTFLDVSAGIPDRKFAEFLGKKFNQIAIWDAKKGAEIPTGGTGEAIPNLGDPATRLDAAQESFKQRARRAQYSPDVSEKRKTDETIAGIADSYMRTAGLEHKPFSGYDPVNEERAKRLADAYARATHSPDDPAVQQAYHSLATETINQWNAIAGAGYRLEPWTQPGQPYANSAAMMKDVKENKHLWFFPTEGGFGSSEGPTTHPLLESAGVTVNGVPLVVNDIFRAVHDFFGHAKEGYEFGPRGEYNAYLAHSRMFSDEALPALASETLGQNSWVNFGPHMRGKEGQILKKGEKGFLPITERPFADQKATILDPDLVSEATPKFSPDTGAGRDLEKKGFRVEKGMEDGEFKVKLLKKGKLIGHIKAAIENPEVARVTFVQIDPDFQGKNLSEALYRELGSSLQKMGIRELTGEAEHPAVVKQRQKVFGDLTEDETDPNRTNSYGGDVRHVASYIDPDVKFSPDDRVTQARPGGKKPVSPSDVDVVGTETALSQPGMVSFVNRSTKLVRNLPGFKDIPLTGGLAKRASAVVDRIKDNLLFVFDRSTPEERDNWRKWYDIAHDMSERWGPEYGLRPDTVSAINARLSPQKDWYENVTLTRLLLNTIRDNPKWTEEDRLFTLSVLRNTKDPKDRAARIAEMNKIKVGTPLSKLDPLQAAFLIRAHNERLSDQTVRDQNLQPVAGASSKVRWQGYEAVASAVRIQRGQTLETVNQELGGNHKVRNFYNNHVAPEDARDVTVDTHAAAAGTLMPMGSLTPFIKFVFGGVKHLPSGFVGTYYLFADAYRRAAAERGVLPREMQSVTWEKIRQMISPAGKRKTWAMDFVGNIHTAADKGLITHENARDLSAKAMYYLSQNVKTEEYPADLQPYLPKRK